MLATSALHHAQTSNLPESQSQLLPESWNLPPEHRPVADISAANCDALCACAVLIFIVTVALPRPNEQAILQRIVEFSELAKGGEALVLWNHQALVAGRLRALVDLESWDLVPPLPEELTRPLQDIKQLVISSPPDDLGQEKRKSIYLQAIDTLEKTPAAMFHNASHPTVIFIFLTLVDRQFINLVAQSDLTALRILGHYGVCVSSVRGKWWMKAFASDIVGATRYILMDESSSSRSGSDEGCKLDRSPAAAILL